MKKLSVWIAALTLALSSAGLAHAAGTNTLVVSATVLSKSICKFNTATSIIDFGNLDPGTGSDVPKSASIQFRCLGSTPNATYSISHDNGLYSNGPGPNLMEHTSSAITEYLPYTLAISPAAGTVAKNTTNTITVTGIIRGADYKNATAGSYTDTVVISIVP